MHQKILSAVAIITLAGPAAAADLPARYRPVPAVAPVATYDWTGIYLGGHGGYGRGSAQWSEIAGLSTAVQDDTVTGQGPSHRPRGAIAGGHVGLQYQWDAFVFGLEFSGAWTNLQDSSCCLFGALDDHYTTTIHSLYQFVGRLGFAFGAWHTYIKGGYAGGRVGIKLADPVTSGAEKQWTDGFVAGGGLEFALTPYVILGADYSYIRLNTLDHTLPLIGDGTVAYDVKIPGIHAIVGRASYKFGGMLGAP